MCSYTRPNCVRGGLAYSIECTKGNERDSLEQFLKPNDMWRMVEIVIQCYFGVNDGILYFGLISQPDFHMFNLHDSFSDSSKDNLCREQDKKFIT